MTDDLGRWLGELGLAKYADLFSANEIELATLRQLSEDDLKELGLPMGPRKKLLAAIATLGPAELERLAAPPVSREGERRQLTVMFVDLVGSTALSTKVDIEELREVTRRYQNLVAAEVARYEGHVARFMGDGVLVYFGYPAAHEDSAERAVRAALAVATAIGREVFAGERLEVRIGVATGHVVVGDLVGEGAAQEEAVIGETPNLAARLQALAAPGAIVVAAATRDLLGSQFELEALGQQRLKGFAEPVSCWRVVGEQAVTSRFEATRGGTLTRFVGRDQELSLLEERWSRACDGEGQIVFLTGQAGIGKSRLIHALRERLAGARHTRLSYQCSPYHTSSALHPFIVQLERAAGFAAEDTAEAKRAKLEGLLRAATDDVRAALPLIGSLLSLPAAEGAAEPEPDPRRHKQRTFAALLDQLTGLAAREPVLATFEDAHWADPTSLELMERMVDHVQDAPVLAIVSARPEFKAPWTSRGNVTLMTLNRLGRRYGAEIVADLTGGKALPRVVLDQIVARTDGVPLFVEELTKAVLESGLLRDAGDHLALTRDLPSLAIPSTLHDSLMARLDRLAPVKEVAQIGAAIGREFPHRLLAKVSSLDEDDLSHALGELIHADLVIRRGSPLDAVYVFKHALVRDTAYGSLLRGKRQAIHERIATALAAEYPESLNTEPELLAHHYTEAGLGEQAIPYWQKAGRRAAERVADAEAREHLQRAVKLLQALPESMARDERELEILILLGSVVGNIEGSASDNVGTTYLHARSLCERVGERAQRFPVVWGLFHHEMHSGRLDSALGFAHEALELGESLGNEDYLLQAHHAVWTCQGWLGDYSAQVTHADKGLALYDVRRHRAHAFTYGGHDPGVCAALSSAAAHWFLGYPDQARKRSERSLQLAPMVAHAFTTANALGFASIFHLLRHEPKRGLELADELIPLCEAHKLAIWRANGQILRCWALTELGRASEVMDDLRSAIRQRQAAGGSRSRVALYLAALGQALAQVGETAEARSVIEEAVIEMEKSGERTYESFIHWARGRIYAAGPQQDLGRAAACYRESLAIARRQSARSMELRAATSLAELWSSEDRKTEARSLLVPLYAWFTE
jgi:class 3 adenylate cyclase/tetratricopeptide (TPR) repeat protein